MLGTAAPHHGQHISLAATDEWCVDEVALRLADPYCPLSLFNRRRVIWLAGDAGERVGA